MGPGGNEPIAHSPAGRAQGMALIMVTALPILALQVLVPDLPQLMQHFRGQPDSDLLVPMILTTPALCIALFSSPAGVLADLWGRRGLLLVALCAYGALGMAPLLFHSLRGILGSRIVVGLAEASAVTAGSSLLGDYFTDRDRKRWLSYQQMVTPLFAAFSYLVGGQLAAIHWWTPFWIYSVAFGFFAIAATCLPAGTTMAPAAHGHETAERFPWRRAALVCGVTLVVSLAFWTQIVQHGRIFAALGVKSPATIGRLTMIAGLTSMGGAFLFRRNMHRRVGQLLALMLALYVVCYLGLSVSRGVAVGLPLDALGMVASGLMAPTCVPWALRHFNAQHRGRGIGLYTASFYMGQFVSAPLFTLLQRSAGSFMRALAVLGGACACGVVLLLIADRLTNRHSPAPAYAVPAGTVPPKSP